MSNSSQTKQLLMTSVVGSYPQPDWLVDKEVLRGGLVPRVRSERIWRIPPENRAEAHRDAATVAIRDMERAGIDVITDGEISRESYSSHFIAGLEGIDNDNPATITSRAGNATRVARIVGAVRHRGSVELEPARFLRAHTTHWAKITLPGPFTLSQLAKDEHYRDPAALAWDFAIALNQEARALESSGVDVIQLDEPWLRNDPEGARRHGVRCINRALEGLKVRTAVHMCFGYAFLRRGPPVRTYDFLGELSESVADEISIEAAQPDLDLGVLRDLGDKAIALGVLDHSTPEAEPVDVVAKRIRAALKYLAPEKLVPSPDCGMKYMTRQVALARLQALSAAAALVRAEIS
jgi:5-methyltetrahydropteroyltriglutamate--homocysteine methyltransferase